MFVPQLFGAYDVDELALLQNLDLTLDIRKQFKGGR